MKVGTYARVLCSLFMYNVSVKPQGCNVFSFSLRYCLVIMCSHYKFLDLCRKKMCQTSVVRQIVM